MFDEKLNNENYKRTITKLHHADWKNSYFKSTGFYMLDRGCGFSWYPQFYEKKPRKVSSVATSIFRQFLGK